MTGVSLCSHLKWIFLGVKHSFILSLSPAGEMTFVVLIMEGLKSQFGSPG